MGGEECRHGNGIGERQKSGVMVAKISMGSSLYGALAYNGEKINEARGKLLATNKIYNDGTGTVDIGRALNDFLLYMPSQTRVEKPVVHISLNPVGTAVVMVISSFFNDRKTIFVIYATSIAVWITSAFMYNYGVTSAGKALDVRDFVATFLLISCVLAISVILYNFNKLQVEDVVEYYDGEKKLQEKLSTDYLTQLHTRFSIYENIKQAMHDYYFSGKDVCVAMLDIDFFKKVNDTYGHDKGDMVLRTLSRVISQYTDDTIHAGRYGGEEFLILFSGYTRKQAGKILEGMLTNFRNQEYDFLPEDVIITFSAGFTYLDNKNIDVEGFIKCADEALYYSKEHGRNQITYYNDLRLRDMQVNR